MLRTRLRTQGMCPGSDEGGTPSGFFTGGTGVTVYRGDAYPAEFHGNLFVGDVANNIVHRALAGADGVLVTARSAEPGPRVPGLAPTTAFRPVQMANGPDGCLWVIDMYRELIEGAAFLPPADPEAPRRRQRRRPRPDLADRARRGTAERSPKLGKATTAVLVALLEHPNGWHRDTASRLLYQRQDRGRNRAAAAARRAIQSPLARTHALYALAGLGVLDARRCARTH